MSNECKELIQPITGVTRNIWFILRFRLGNCRALPRMKFHPITFIKHRLSSNEMCPSVVEIKSFRWKTRDIYNVSISFLAHVSIAFFEQIVLNKMKTWFDLRATMLLSVWYIRRPVWVAHFLICCIFSVAKNMNKASSITRTQIITFVRRKSVTSPQSIFINKQKKHIFGVRKSLWKSRFLNSQKMIWSISKCSTWVGEHAENPSWVFVFSVRIIETKNQFPQLWSISNDSEVFNSIFV